MSLDKLKKIAKQIETEEVGEKYSTFLGTS